MTQRRFRIGGDEEADGKLSVALSCMGEEKDLHIGLALFDEWESAYCLLPVGDARHGAVVEAGTLVAVVAAWVWVMYRLIGVTRRKCEKLGSQQNKSKMD